MRVNRVAVEQWLKLSINQGGRESAGLDRRGQIIRDAHRTCRTNSPIASNSCGSISALNGP